MAAEVTDLELSEGSAHKFYEVTVDGRAVTTGKTAAPSGRARPTVGSASAGKKSRSSSKGRQPDPRADPSEPRRRAPAPGQATVGLPVRERRPQRLILATALRLSFRRLPA
jgi:hypothetical protein